MKRDSRSIGLLAPLGALLLASSCAVPPAGQDRDARENRVAFAASQEHAPDLAGLVGEAFAEGLAVPEIQLERVTAGVPWPRGLAWADDGLVVLARGRHRRAGGIDPSIDDMSGSLLRVDPNISEPVRPGVGASEKTRRNAKLLVAPTGSPFYLYDGRPDPISDTRMDRPYCTLVWDPASRNFFICGFSGVDLPGGKFRKNATDSIHRYDMRSQRWESVELHDPTVVPESELTNVVPNRYYPHHDPAKNPAPHGRLNGPDGGCVAGRWFYALGKDNHVVVRYDLAAIRKDAAAPAPHSEVALDPYVRLSYPGGERDVALFGPSAIAYHDSWLYIGYRTTSAIVRYRLDEDHRVVEPRGELVAVFEPWSPERRRSANVIDIAFNSKGELYVSCAGQGRIWKIGKPSAERPFYGDDQSGRATSAKPLIDLAKHRGKKAACGNLLFDDLDRLYVCVGNYDADRRIAGAVYRAVELDASDIADVRTAARD